MTPVELKNYYRAQLVSPRNISQEITSLDAIVDFITQSLTDGIPAWTAALTFNTDGTGDGAFSLYPDVDGNLRFWQTKIDGNINHAPSTNPAVHEDTYWKEVSPSSGSALKEWEAGVFGNGLVIVYFDVNGDGTGMDLFKLTNPARPFNSTDFAAELAAGTWQKIGGPVHTTFDTTAAPLVLDVKRGNDVIFEGSAAFGVAKTFQFNNTTGNRRMTILFELSAAVTLTFPPTVKMANFLGEWDAVNYQWTPAGAGQFEVELTKKGANWLMKINGPF